MQILGRSPSQDESCGSLPTERRVEIINHIEGKIQVKNEITPTNDGSSSMSPKEPDREIINRIQGESQVTSEIPPINDGSSSRLAREVIHSSPKPEIRELSFAADHTTANINQTPKQKATHKQHRSGKPINQNVETQCTLCNKTFANYRSLYTHKRRIHLKNYKYNCEDCDQRFIARYKYVEHRRRCHTHEKPYQCDICKKRYFTRERARCHMKNHTGINPVICKICGQLFAVNDNLKDHLKECEAKRSAEEISKSTTPLFSMDYEISVHNSEGLEKSLLKDKTKCGNKTIAQQNSQICTSSKSLSLDYNAMFTGSENELRPSLLIQQDLSGGHDGVSFVGDDQSAEHSEIPPNNDGTSSRLPREVNHTSLKPETQPPTAVSLGENLNEASASDCTTEKLADGKESFNLEQIRRSSRNKWRAPSLVSLCDNRSKETQELSFAVDHATANINQTPKQKAIHEQQRSGKPINKKAEAQCTLCNKTFAGYKNLLTHKHRMHSKNYKYNCEDCEQRFIARYKYVEHRRRFHTFEKPYQCDICKKRYSTREGARCHMKKHTGINPVICKICGQLYALNGNLKTHLEECKRFQCDVCSKLLTSAAGLRKHKKHIHDRDYDRKYICEFCGQRFCIMIQCLDHIRTCHTEEKPYLCQHCAKSFPSARSLKVHQYFSHNDHKPHKCAVCGKGYTSLGPLKAHLLRHSGEAPYSCPICENRFSTKYELKCHRKLLKMHWSCNNCNKLFCTNRSLFEHMKICQPVPPKPVMMKKENVHNKTEEGFQEKGANISCEENDLEVENHGNQLELENQTIQAGKETGHVQVQMDEVDEILLGNGQTQDSQSVSNQCNIKPLMCKNCGKTFSSLHTFSRHHNNRACSALLELKSNKAQNVDQHLLLSLQQHRYSEETQKIVSDTMSHKVIKFAQSKRTSIGLQPEGNMQIICDLCGKVCASKSSRYHHRKQVHLKNFNYKHVCKFCGKRFYKIVPYRSHVYTHTGERPFKCDICQKTFTSKKSLRTHMLRHQERVVCPICNVSYSTKYGYKTHVRRVHLNRELFTCDICHTIKRNKTSLRIHMRSHTQEKKEFQCERCSKWFVSSESRKKHMNKACPVGGCYICRDCMKPCATKKILRWHMEQTHKEPMLKRQFACNICNRRFVNQQSLANHILTHGNEKPFQCSNCPKTFFTRQHLKAHMISHQTQKHFTCSECSKEFKYRNSLSLHKRKYCHASGTYLCRDCPSKFATREALLSHFEREQISNGTPKNKILQRIEKLYKCDVCLKSFAKKQVLETHMDSHVGKQFKCKNCSKLFTYFNGLWIHMKKYCRDCPSKLAAREDVLSHFEREQISNGTPKIEKLYKCDVCLKSFANKQVLGTHMDSHAGKQFKCKNCSKLFTYYSGLWIHMKKYCKSNKL